MQNTPLSTVYLMCVWRVMIRVYCWHRWIQLLRVVWGKDILHCLKAPLAITQPSKISLNSPFLGIGILIKSGDLIRFRNQITILRQSYKDVCFSMKRQILTKRELGETLGFLGNQSEEARMQGCFDGEEKAMQHSFAQQVRDRLTKAPILTPPLMSCASFGNFTQPLLACISLSVYLFICKYYWVSTLCLTTYNYLENLILYPNETCVLLGKTKYK